MNAPASMRCPCCHAQIAEHADLIMDFESGIVVARGRFVHFTPQEFSLLISLYDHKPNVRSKEQLLKAISESKFHDDEAEIKIVDVAVCKIRKKLEGIPLLIQTVWGNGYRLMPEAMEKNVD